MEESFNNEKAKILEMQANYLRYLASIYPIQVTPRESQQSSPYSSASPQRSSRDVNPHDDIPVKKVQKPFEVLLEEQLTQNPSAEHTKNYSVGSNILTSSNSKFLKRGEGHLCSFTRSFSSSRLRSLRNKIMNNETEKNENSAEKEIEKINSLKRELVNKNEELKKEEKELLRKKKIELDEIKRIKLEKNKEIRTNARKNEEVEKLKQQIQKMIEADKIKDLRYQEEIKKLNLTISKLNKKVQDLEKNAFRPSPSKNLLQTSNIKSFHNTPERKADFSQTQGKIKMFVEKKKKNALNGKRESENKFTVTHFPNKDIRQNFSDGKVVHFYAASNTTLTTFPNGLKVYKFANGQIEKIFADGTKEINYIDGTIKTIFNNGNEETIYPDGAVELVNKYNNREVCS